ncbi:MAG: oligopeptide transporter, OPT family [Chlamydiae bacterium CG10_big_fil_rev_8_21_14_0_10_42_34]|nr:MAG: oligopeptide transporter, OPT family [Chlamydiae bacterium CG10_big_fil_rev_8_21_14_0_10_42_34]
MSNHETFQPHVPSSTVMKEFSLRATILGLIFGFFFAVANAYLALKIGTTVSASIPAAIMSMGVLKLLFKNSTILENNIVQTIATIGEGLAAGVIFTIPALILLGDSPSIGKIFILSSLGGLLGILFMIPMRRFLIVQEHKTLPFPEGTACAAILKSGEKNHKTAMMALWGLLAAGAYKICSNAIFLWQETVSWSFKTFNKAEFSIDATPALLGVGYIIGPRIAGFMFAGGALAWWVIIPLIVEFGLGTATVYPSAVPIAQMSSEMIWDSYVRYIGAGCLGIGGIYSLVKIAPLLLKTIHVSVKELFGGYAERANLPRTEKDISLAWLLIGSIAIILFLWGFPTLPMNFLTILLLVILSFFFVAVTSITVGLVGSTSNPVSGMTITTLLITCIIFVLLGWTERVYLISAMTMGCVACCAITLAGTTAQDLKAGFLLGATPRSQQLAEILGVLIPSLALGYTVYILNQAYGIGSSVMPAPQATLMSLIVKGVIGGNLPYALVGSGVVLGIIMIVLGIPVLPFALGLYLPLSLSLATMVGGIVRAYVNHKGADDLTQEKGILLASGFIGGDACVGVLIALAALGGVIPVDKAGFLPNWVALLAFILLGAVLAIFTLRKSER